MEKTHAERKFRVRAPRLKQGRQDTPLFATNMLWAHLKVYAEGGENDPHSHPLEDHSFIVFDGESTFFDGQGQPTVVRKWEGISLPMGTVYSFRSTGDCDLVMLRIGSGSNSREPGKGDERVGVDGQPMRDNPRQPKAPPVQIPGKFFGD